MADSKDHYTKKECTSFLERHPLKGLEMMDYPINKKNPKISSRVTINPI
jgi:hypothetical protein